MSDEPTIYAGGQIFDGERMLSNHAAIFESDGRCRICRDDDLPPDATIVDLDGDILSPGFTDLQVNGGGGVMLNDDPTIDTIRTIANAHRSLRTAGLLPTLITDSAAKTLAAIEATGTAIESGVPGVLGLHLEGPHLSVVRKGAHDAALIRPMEDSDLEALVGAARALPALMVTVAPENVTPEQVSALSSAGAIVSLGHTDADFDTCRAYVAAGARCATHLFNAMSQLGNRAPGLVGAVLATGEISAGIIADGIHVHPAALRTAWTAKKGPGEIFLVSDAMAVAGTKDTAFELGGRQIHRADGRLTLEDGTLAGADLDLATAVRVLVNEVGVDLAGALRAATTVPRGVLGLPAVSLRQDFIRIKPDLGSATPIIDHVA